MQKATTHKIVLEPDMPGYRLSRKDWSGLRAYAAPASREEPSSIPYANVAEVKGETNLEEAVQQKSLSDVETIVITQAIVDAPSTDISNVLSYAPATAYGERFYIPVDPSAPIKRRIRRFGRLHDSFSEAFKDEKRLRKAIVNYLIEDRDKAAGNPGEAEALQTRDNYNRLIAYVKKIATAEELDVLTASKIITKDGMIVNVDPNKLVANYLGYKSSRVNLRVA